MKSNRTAILLFVGALVPMGHLAAQSPTVSAELAFHTRYLFAGIPFATGEVQQGKVTVASGGLTVNAFAVYDFDASDITETDVWGDYYAQVSPRLGIYLGAGLYNFLIAGAWEATPELYGGVVLTAPLSPALYVAHDFDLGDGTHAYLSLSHSIETIPGGPTVDLAARVEYNDGYYVPDSGFSFFDVTAAVSLPFKRVTVTPVFVVQRGLDDKFGGIFVDDEVFGLRVAYTF